jgi:two-component system, cell cycle response regulator
MTQPSASLAPFRVALAGFSAFERSALASFFRLGAQRSPAFEQVAQIDACDFIVADADHAASLAVVQTSGRAAETVFVGAHPPAGAMAWLPRPIDPLLILRELDALVGQRQFGRPAAAAARPDLPLSLNEPATPEPVPAIAPLRASGAGREVLVVDDSGIARKFLQQRLRGLGYRVQTASSAERALELLDAQSYCLVFLDIVLGPPGGIDGLQVCQTIRQRAAATASAAPGIVIATGSTSGADRVRGSLAGCNAYLVKPLCEAEFILALRRADPLFNTGFAALEG